MQTFAVFSNVGSQNKPIYKATIRKGKDAAYAVRGIVRRIDLDCARCLILDSSDVAHDSCIYNGERPGHSKAHCTATSCF